MCIQNAALFEYLYAILIIGRGIDFYPMYFSAADHTVCLNSIFAGVWTPAFKIYDLIARSSVAALFVSSGTKEMTERYFATDTD